MAAKAKNSSSRTRTKGVTRAESDVKTRAPGVRSRVDPAHCGCHPVNGTWGSGRLQLPGQKRARHLGGSVEGHQLPCLRSGEKCAGQRVVERMPGLECNVGSDQRVAQQIQVANRVEHFVDGELVIVTQAFA